MIAKGIQMADKETKARRRKLFCFFLCGLCALGALSVAPALAFDWKKESIPEKWIRPLVPEEEKHAKYPTYYGDLDKARAQAFSGLYRRALVTLSTGRDIDPVEGALVRATSLASLGRTDEALAALA